MHVLITGASSGIGEAIAVEYARGGANVTLAARREAELQRVGASLGAGVKHQVIPFDLAGTTDVSELWARAEAGLGPIDVLVNNAGMTLVGRSTDPIRRSGRALLGVNLLAPLDLIMVALPPMVARRSGTIVNIASIAAFLPTMASIHYNASKAGLAAASESLRPEVKPFGVHVMTVYPGPTETPLMKEAYSGFEKKPMAAVGRTDVLARRVVAGVRSRATRIVYPRIYYFARWFPDVSRWSADRTLPAIAKATRLDSTP